MSELKWGCGCYEHDGVLTPCTVDPKTNPVCFRLKAMNAVLEADAKDEAAFDKYTEPEPEPVEEEVEEVHTPAKRKR